MRYTKFQHWVKLQRKFRKTQKKLLTSGDYKLTQKLESIKKRITALNHRWRLGIPASVLTAWFAFSPTGNLQAQGPVFKSPVVIEDFNDDKGFFFNGSRNSFGKLGTIVTNIGDFNGDGIDDIVMSAPERRYFDFKDGVAYIVFGTDGEESFEKNSASFFPTAGGLRLVGGQDRDRLGVSITAVGDVNGDGLNDVAFRLNANTENEYNAGSVFIIFGDADISEQKTINVNELDGSNGVAIYGLRQNDRLSLVSSSPLNINNDEVNDLAFVSAANGTQIIYGSSSIGNDSIIDLSTVNEADGINITRNGESFSATSILSMDINNDGTNDIIVGNTDLRRSDNPGVAYTYFGSEGSLPDTLDINNSSFNDLTIRGTDLNTNIGKELINIGDINNDGVKDLGIRSNNRVNVVFGNDEFTQDSLSVDQLNATNGFVVDGDETTSFANSLSAAGDFNGDGIADFVIGSPSTSTNGNRAGSAYLIFGREEYTASIDPTSIDGSDGIIFHGVENPIGTYLGTSLSFLNDINGDGQDELLIGMPGNNWRDGKIAVVAGINSPTELALVNPLSDFIIYEDTPFSYQIPSNTFTSPSKTDDFNFSATLTDGEDLPEWLTFSPETRTFSGIPEDKDTGLLSVLLTLESEGDTATDNFEIRVVDAALFPPIQSAEELNNELTGSIIRASSDADKDIVKLGNSVSSAGDINGDGIDDVLITALDSYHKGNYTGAAVVIFGSNERLDPNFKLSEIDGTNGFIIIGEKSEKFGHSASPLGDVNGDGLDDLIIGTNPYYSSQASRRVSIVFGSQEQFPKTLDATDLDGENGFNIVNESVGNTFGLSFGKLGDINGDGLNDIVIGSRTSKTDVVFGRNSLDNPFPSLINVDDLSLEEKQAVNLANRINVGDFNNDGMEDFVLRGGHLDSTGNSIFSNFLIFGNENLPDEIDFNTIDGSNGFLLSGFNTGTVNFVDKAGDFNNDGIEDFFVRVDDTIHILFGSERSFSPRLEVNSQNNGSGGVSITDLNITGSSRVSIGNAGDVNGDKIDDLIIGISTRTPTGERKKGFAHVIFGNSNWGNGSFSTEEIDGENGFSVYGEPGPNNDHDFAFSTSGLGDINNDGFNDVIVGNPRYGYARSFRSGAVYIIYGKGPVAPVLENPIPDQGAQVNFAFGLTLPDSTFSDANFGDMGVYAARLENGDPLPSWLSFDADSRTFSGTPELADVAVNSIVVTLTDEDDLTASDTFNLAVLENLGPDIDPIANQEVEEETTLTFTVTATDLETAVEDITFSLGAISTDKGMTVSPEGLFSWTPTEAQSGEHLVTLFASDGVSSSEEEFMILVTEVNTAPSLNAIEDLEVGAEREFTFTVEANDPDIPVQDLSFEIDSISFNKGMRIDSASGLISWTPTEEQEGEHSVLLTVTDGELSDSLSFIITVDLELGINKLANIGIETFPNPVKDQLNILFNDSFKGNKVYVTVQTLSGVSVLTKTASKNLSVLDLSSLESGSYLLVLTSENGKKQVTPLVKQ